MVFTFILGNIQSNSYGQPVPENNSDYLRPYEMYIIILLYIMRAVDSHSGGKLSFDNVQISRTQRIVILYSDNNVLCGS